MINGTINHIALTVTDLEASKKFYDRVLGFFGYRQGQVPQSTQDQMKTALLAWTGPGSSVTLRPAKSPYQNISHQRDAAGLNHLAFALDSREAVDSFYALLKEIGCPILDEPAEYTYAPGYYAVYFLDPSGIKLEAVYWPKQDK